MNAAINTMKRSEHFTATFPHYHVSNVITTVVHIPFTSIEKLLLPFHLDHFNLYAGICVHIILICCSYRQRFVFGRANHTPFLNAINILLGGAVIRPPTHNFARTLFAFWLFGTLVLRSSYQGALFEFLYSHKSAQTLDTLEKLADNNLPIYAPPQIYNMMYELRRFTALERQVHPTIINQLLLLNRYF